MIEGIVTVFFAFVCPYLVAGMVVALISTWVSNSHNRRDPEILGLVTIFWPFVVIGFVCEGTVNAVATVWVGFYRGIGRLVAALHWKIEKRLYDRRCRRSR